MIGDPEERSQTLNYPSSFFYLTPVFSVLGCSNPTRTRHRTIELRAVYQLTLLYTPAHLHNDFFGTGWHSFLSAGNAGAGPGGRARRDGEKNLIPSRHRGSLGTPGASRARHLLRLGRPRRRCRRGLHAFPVSGGARPVALVRCFSSL